MCHTLHWIWSKSVNILLFTCGISLWHFSFIQSILCIVRVFISDSRLLWQPSSIFIFMSMNTLSLSVVRPIFTQCLPSTPSSAFSTLKNPITVVKKSKWYPYFNCMGLKFEIHVFFFMYFYFCSKRPINIFLQKRTALTSFSFLCLIKWKWQNMEGLSSEAWL